ncbi:MAG: agmatine deiminase family protein [Bacteroidota bacterium]
MNNFNNQFPSESGYRMPAEWGPHSATLLTWPHNRETWPGSHLSKVEEVYRVVVLTLLKYEPVLLLAANQRVKARAKSLLKGYEELPNPLTILESPVNDVWIRDYGPICIRNENGILFTDWEYNAWGGKYPPWSDDNGVPLVLADLLGVDLVKPGIVLEGGSIETNGEGVFLATESVLLNPNRNPGLTKREIEKKLVHYLGATQVLWLKEGLIGDDTDGHIDDLTRFVNKNTVVTALPESTGDPNYPALAENITILNKTKLKNGETLNVITLPLPETKVNEATVDGSDYVPASYANFYIANGALLLPLYDERYDAEMLNVFQTLFPNREIEGIHCADLVWGQGSLHCITQQLLGTQLPANL